MSAKLKRIPEQNTIFRASQNKTTELTFVSDNLILSNKSHQLSGGLSEARIGAFVSKAGGREKCVDSCEKKYSCEINFESTEVIRIYIGI